LPKPDGAGTTLDARVVLSPATLVARCVRDDLALRLGKHRYPPNSPRTFGDRVLRTAAWLREQGLGPGRVCLIVDEDPDHTLRTFLASVLVGATPAIHASVVTSGGPTRAFDSLRRRRKVFGAGCVVLATSELSDVLADGWGCDTASTRLDIVAVPESPELPPLAREYWHEPSAREIAYYQLSSGTTGDSKAIAISWRALSHCIYAHDRFAAPYRRVAHWMPLNHDFGLMVSVWGLVYAESLTLDQPTDFLRDPAIWLRALTETQANYTAAVPFALKVCASRLYGNDLSAYDLSHLKFLALGGEPANAQHCRDFFNTFAPTGLDASSWCVGYGLGEATCVTHSESVGEGRLAVVRRGFFAPGYPVQIERVGGLFMEQPAAAGCLEVASIGRTGAEMTAWLIDEAGNRIEDDAICGELVVDGPMMASCYLTERGKEPIVQGGFRTGDLGFKLDGHFFIIDRLNNLIIRRGQNFVARDLEIPISNALGIREANVFVVDTDLREPDAPIVVVIEDHNNLELEAAPKALATLDLPVPLHRLVVVDGRADTRTSSGKKRYVWLRHLLASGRLKTLAEVELVRQRTSIRAVNTLIEEILPAFAGVSSARPLASDVLLREDLGLDSVAVTELGASMEERLRIRLDIEELFRARTIGDLGRAVASAPSTTEGPGLTHAMTERIMREIPQTLVEVEQARGREILVDGRWCVDFASCNYLGLDLDEDVISCIEPALRIWGVHPSWSRAVASPRIYRDVERALARAVGAADVLCYPTITLLHAGVLPLLCDQGTLILDSAVHQSLHGAAKLVTAGGAKLSRFPHGDLDTLERLLERTDRRGETVIAVDGVYSMTGAPADLPALVALAERYDATVYVDDAHGFGVLGANPSERHPWGLGGGGIVRWFGLDYDRIHYVAGLSKAYSSMGAFITCNSPQRRRQLMTSDIFVQSGPVPVASLASTLTALDVDLLRGDALRAHMLSLTEQLLAGAHALGLRTSGAAAQLPIVSVVVGDLQETIRACKTLWEHGVLITPAVYPVVPIEENGLRFSVTAANTPEQVTRALRALEFIVGSR
jgi:8-amino-7-oxononanoate synthase